MTVHEMTSCPSLLHLIPPHFVCLGKIRKTKETCLFKCSQTRLKQVSHYKRKRLWRKTFTTKTIVNFKDYNFFQPSFWNFRNYMSKSLIPIDTKSHYFSSSSGPFGLPRPFLFPIHFFIGERLVCQRISLSPTPKSLS